VKVHFCPHEIYLPTPRSRVGELQILRRSGSHGGSNPPPPPSSGGSAAIFLVTVWPRQPSGDGIHSTSGRGRNLYRRAQPLRDTPIFPGSSPIVLPPSPKHMTRHVAGKRFHDFSTIRKSSCISTRLTSLLSAGRPTYASRCSPHSSDRASSVEKEKHALEMITDRDQR